MANSGRGQTNLIVNYLPNHMDEAQLGELFSSVATPTYVKVMKNSKGESKGYGFVNFATREEAVACQRRFNRYQITARKQLKVSWSRPGDRVGCNLHVKHIPQTWNEEDLHELFAPFGQINDVRVLRFPNSIYNKETGFVRFDSLESAREAARSLHGIQPPGHPESCIQIEIAHKDMKKIESRHQKKVWKDSYFQENTNNFIVALTSLLAERKELDQKLRHHAAFCDIPGSDMEELRFARASVADEMKSLLLRLYKSEPTEADVFARIDDELHVWVQEFRIAGQGQRRRGRRGPPPSLNRHFPSHRRMHHPKMSVTAPEFVPHGSSTSFGEGQRPVMEKAKFPTSVTQSPTPSTSNKSSIISEKGNPLSNPTSSDCASSNSDIGPFIEDMEKPCSVFFSNFPPSFAEPVIRPMFETICPVERLDFETDNQGNKLGMGFIHFQNGADALKAIQALNGAILFDRQITLRIKK